MTPQELKNSILQRAIQGKLVEQRPEEGTGEELYKQIQAEKARLIKEGKIRKGKQLSSISDSEIPFEIPENWKWVHLGMICKEILVPQRDKPKSFNGDIPWCRIEDIEGKYLNRTKSNQFVSQQIVDSMNLKVNPVGTVISANSASVGAAAICKVRCVTNQTFIGLVCSDGVFNEYLYYFLKANVNTIKKLGAGTTILYVSQDKYWNLPFPLPPLLEQERIVAKIEELLPLVEQYEKAYNRLEQLNKQFPDDMKKSILQMAIQGKLVEQRPEDGTGEELFKQIQAEKARLIKEGKFKKDKPLPPISEDETPFEIPESWKWARLSDICTQISDGTHKTPKYVEKGIPFVSVKDISSGFLDLGNTKLITKEEHLQLISRCKPEMGDVLICRIGTLGKAIPIDTTVEFSIFVSLGLIKPVFKVLNEFILTAINSGYGYSWIQKVKVGGGTHTFKINLDDLRLMAIPLPPLAEQKRIVAKIEELLPLCDLLSKKQ